MQEIERFFTNLFSGVFNRFKYDAIETAERKAREAIDARLNPPSEAQPRSHQEEPKQHKEEEW